MSLDLDPKVMDNAIAAVFGKSCALNLTPFQNVWTDAQGRDEPVPASGDFFSCADTNDVGAGNPWGCHVVLSLGYALTMAMALPCGRFGTWMTTWSSRPWPSSSPSAAG